MKDIFGYKQIAPSVIFKFNNKYKQIAPSVIFKFNNKFYRWCGWFGCQLESFGYRRLKPNHKIILDLMDGNDPIEMTIYTCERHGFFTYRYTWAVDASGTHAERTARIWELKSRLQRCV